MPTVSTGRMSSDGMHSPSLLHRSNSSSHLSPPPLIRSRSEAESKEESWDENENRENENENEHENHEQENHEHEQYPSTSIPTQSTLLPVTSPITSQPTRMRILPSERYVIQPSPSTRLLLSFIEIYILGHYNLNALLMEPTNKSDILRPRALQFYTTHQSFLS